MKNLHIIGRMLSPEMEKLETRYKRIDFLIKLFYRLSMTGMLALFILLMYFPEQAKAKSIPIGSMAATPGLCFILLYMFFLPNPKQQQIDKRKITRWSVDKGRLTQTKYYRTVSRMLDEGLTPEHIMRHHEGAELYNTMRLLLMLTCIEIRYAEGL